MLPILTHIDYKAERTMQPPRLFISYSWTSPDHEQWVLSLATELRDNGIDVILDKWDLKEGHDAHAFMERMVTDQDIKKVALICDRVYAEKADGRSGGVGAETQIISPEIYAKQDQNKFVAVLPQRDQEGRPYLPAYYKSRIYIDLSNPDLYGRNFEQLLRWACDKPLHVKPELGKTPTFLDENGNVSLPTAVTFRRAVVALRESRPYCDGALVEYFDVVAESLERFRISDDGEEFDERVVNSVTAFLPSRNEILEIFTSLARYHPTDEAWDALHGFFEKLVPYFDRPEGVTRWQEREFDNFKFIINELFLYAITSLIRHERFTGVAHLVRQHYYVPEGARHGVEAMVPFSVFRNHLASLEHRKKRLKLNRLSLHADLLEQRSKSSGLLFQHLMQADLVLFMRDCLDCLRADRMQQWWPVTLVYASRQYGPFEVFARSQSSEYFNRVRHLFDIDQKDDLLPVAEAFKTGRLKIPNWDFDSFGPFELMGFEKLATLP